MRGFQSRQLKLHSTSNMNAFVDFMVHACFPELNMVEYGSIRFNTVSGGDVSTSRQVFVASQVEYG